MCWGAGILLSSGVVRAVTGIHGDMGWKLPFILQWIWPLPLFIGAYFAPESPWNAVRRGKTQLARNSLMRLCRDTPEKEREVEATLAYIRHTTEMEMAETANAGFFECFKGTNLWRTEIVSIQTKRLERQLTSPNRTSSFGQPSSSVVTLFSATRSSSSRPPGSPRCNRST